MVKRKLFYLVCLLVGMVSFCACSSDDDEAQTGFTDVQRQDLTVLNGSFTYNSGMNTTTIEFVPFSSPKEKKSTMNDVPIKFHGTMHYKSQYNDAEYYFYLNTEERQIVAFAKHSEKDDYYNALVGKKWVYSLVDENTITLYDTDLSSPIIHTNTYRRNQD